MSNNLNLDQVAEGQDSAEVTINDQAGQLDAAMTEVLSVPITNTNLRTLTATELRRNFMFDIVDGAPVPTATITLTVPSAIERGLFVVLNETAFDVDVEISGQSEAAATVGAGEASTLYSDGVNVRSVGGGSSGGGPFTSPFTVTNGSENFVLTVVNGALTTLETDSSFMVWTADAGGAAPSLAFSASQFAPDASFDDTITLGDAAARWEALFVGTGTSQFDGHVLLSNQRELRLLESGGANYSAFRAAAAMGGNVTYTLPSADGVAGAELSTSGAGALSWVAPPYDFVGFFATAPAAGELITRIVINRTVTMPINLTGSEGYLGTAATAQTDFDIQKNGASIGTMRFAAAAQVATFIFASAQTLVAGDLLAIVAPNPADATAANLSYALKCTRA